MPKTFRVNPNDRVVRAVVGITTGPRAVTDEQLLALVRQSGDAAFQHLTIDEMNTRLGPKTGSSYAVKDLGIFRQHYKINGQRRCAYVVLSPDELRVGSVGSGSLFFPRGEDDVLNERAERIERPFLLEDGEEEETDDTEMIDAIPAGAAGGRKRKETTKTNMTPAGKKERPEQPALEDLMKVEEQPPCVATRQVASLLQREAELEKRLAEQTMLAAGYFADFAERHARVARWRRSWWRTELRPWPLRRSSRRSRRSSGGSRRRATRRRRRSKGYTGKSNPSEGSSQTTSASSPTSTRPTTRSRRRPRRRVSPQRPSSRSSEPWRGSATRRRTSSATSPAT
mmetsp:Transcript_3631/g.11945  ORF Transcript_3631/g.11945 Transcript_3631/m.11945 type:complete len:341 (-) Transcript_3631:583-1605(-)